MTEIDDVSANVRIDLRTAAAVLGAKGGSRTSRKKAITARRNGRKGGYPKGRPNKKPDCAAITP